MPYWPADEKVAELALRFGGEVDEFSLLRGWRRADFRLLPESDLKKGERRWFTKPMRTARQLRCVQIVKNLRAQARLRSI